MSRCDVQVLQVVQTLEAGGLERVALDLCVGLAARFRMGIACLKGEGPLADELRARHIPVYSWAPRSGRRGAYAAPWRLRALLRDSAVRVVHTHNTGPLYNGTLATFGRHRMALIHTDHARQFPFKRPAMVAESWCARGAFRVVTISERSKQDLVRFEHLAPDSVQVIPNGVDLRRFRELPPPFRRSGGEVVVGSVARLREEKLLEVLVEAIALLRRESFPVRLHLVGDGPCRQALEARARSAGIAEAVDFLGHLPDVAPALADIDVIALASRREGMPLSVLEGMAAGRPVVATAVGGIPEVVEDGRTGCLVPPGDPRALADAIRRVAASPDRARCMGEAGRARAEQRFSLQAMLEAYGSLYEAAMARA